METQYLTKAVPSSSKGNMTKLTFALFALLFIVGCFSTTPESIQPQPPQAADTASAQGINPEFKELHRVINSLYSDKLIIGEDRYMDLKSQLDAFERKGIETSQLPDLRMKLEALRVPGPGNPGNPGNIRQGNARQAENDIAPIEHEIEVIVQERMLVGPDHYKQLSDALDSIESQGADKARVSLLREKLKSINLPGPAPASTVKEEFRKDPEIPSESERRQLPDCGDLLFSTFPVDMEKVYEISPLGAIGPPGHTFPTEHSFIHLHASGTSTKRYDLHAPADVFITHVREIKEATKDPTDYTIYFALCKDIIGYYNHAKEISPEIQQVLGSTKCLDFGQENVCARNTFSKVSAGTMLGKVGGHQGNFDFGLIDLSKNNSFASPARYGTRSLHIQCPYDYYSEKERQKFLSLIKRDDGQKCGTIAQDVPGTLKGNWFNGNARADMSADYERHLAFVQDNGDPDRSILSIGGTISQPRTIIFKPRNEGTTNREFSQVTPDGKTYCFTDGAEKAIVQLMNPAQLRIEQKKGTCTDKEEFTGQHIYNR